MTFDMISFDLRFISTASYCLIGAHEAKRYRDCFPVVPEAQTGEVTLNSSRVAYLILQMMRELTNEQRDFEAAIMVALNEYHREPKSHFGLTVDSGPDPEDNQKPYNSSP